MLAKIEHGMQWAIGDWYKAIPWNDKEATCKKAGLNPKTARDCGWVASQYQSSQRRDNLSFHHHRVLAIKEIDAEQRASLLRRAEWGEEDKDGTRSAPGSGARHAPGAREGATAGLR